MNISELTTLLGWSSVICISILLLTTIMLSTMRGPIVRIHSRMLGLNEEALLGVYVTYLAQFKILVLVFNLAPYIALKIMGN
jgi:hypothetical protein